MDIDYSKIYSVLSSAEEKNSKEIEEAITKFRKLKDIESISSAKEFLVENYGIKLGLKNINGIGVLSIIENENLFSVNFQCANRNIEYNFKKKENK